eukprot:scaffold45383_cov19-Tisochrysis_lutea.AAC.1
MITFMPKLQPTSMRPWRTMIISYNCGQTCKIETSEALACCPAFRSGPQLQLSGRPSACALLLTHNRAKQRCGKATRCTHLDDLGDERLQGLLIELVRNAYGTVVYR